MGQKVSKEENSVKKDQLIDLIKLYIESQLSKKQIKEVLDAAFDIIKDSIFMDGKLYIYDFGTFSLVHKPEKTIFNPLFNKKIKIPARKCVSFKPSLSFKREINN